MKRIILIPALLAACARPWPGARAMRLLCQNRKAASFESPQSTCRNIHIYHCRLVRAGDLHLAPNHGLGSIDAHIDCRKDWDGTERTKGKTTVGADEMRSG